jgi:uncharacterized protein DUF5317
MRLLLTTIPLAVLLGYLAGGRLVGIATMDIRWPALALVGTLLQLVPGRGTVGFALLMLSFVVLFAFVIANLRAAGFSLILAGLALNFAVIAFNGGMPVTRQALEASGQQNTIHELAGETDSKHHLATEDDVLVFLGDAIALPPPIEQVVSLGDIAVYAGAGWMIVSAMRRARPRPGSEVAGTARAGS